MTRANIDRMMQPTTTHNSPLIPHGGVDLSMEYEDSWPRQFVVACQMISAHANYPHTKATAIPSQAAILFRRVSAFKSAIIAVVEAPT